MASVILGGRLIEGRAVVLNREKVFLNLNMMVYINIGEITTTTIALSSEQRLKAIASSAQQAEEFFQNQTKFFDNPLIPMLYLGQEHLDSTLIGKDNDNDPELFVAAGLAKGIFFLQNAILQEIKADNFNQLQDFISECTGLLNPVHPELKEHLNLSPTQQEQAISLILKQVNFLSEGKLEQYLINQITAENDANKVSFFTQILMLLYKPIAWALSLICKPTPVKSEESVVEQAPQEEIQEVEGVRKKTDSVFTPRRIYGLVLIQN